MSSAEEKDLRLICDKKEEELKSLLSELAKAREYEDELEKQVTIIFKEYGLPLPSSDANTSMSQLQQKVEMLERLRGEVNQFNAECNRWKERMDILVAVQETALAKVSTIEIQLRNTQKSSLI